MLDNQERFTMAERGDVMKKVAFFFGAGAEGQGNFNIQTGYEYLKSSLYATQYLSGFNDALSLFFDKKEFFSNGFTYRKDTLDVSTFVLKNFITQKAMSDVKFFDKYRDIILSLLSDEDLRHISDALNRTDIPKHKSNPNDEIKRIKQEFKEILTGEKKKFSEITLPLLCDLFEKKEDKIHFDLNIGIGGSLDSYFHTIIDPHKYSVVRFSKIFNYYWACYFTILRDVVGFLTQNGHEGLNDYLKESRTLNYSAVLNNIELFTKLLYELDIESVVPENSYYRLIRKEIDKHKDKLICQGVVTTNYYRFCEFVHKEPIYLNGQLKLFEYPELLEVIDITSEQAKADKLMFPFIFGQSLVKPIVNSLQTEEFHRMKNLLSEIDTLIVLGFNINEDDNHINAFLHDFVRKGKQLIVVTADENFDAKKKLKCSNNEICICKLEAYGDNNEVVRKMFEDILQNSA